jgi:hypothetical protein
MQQYLEVISNDATPYPEMNAPAWGAGVNFFNSKLLRSSWVLWNGSLYPTTTGHPYNGVVDLPYRACFSDNYWNFRAGKITC